MLYYNGIAISKRININKTSASEECDICHYCYFYESSTRCLHVPGGHDVLVMSANLNDIFYFKHSRC